MRKEATTIRGLDAPQSLHSFPEIRLAFDSLPAECRRIPGRPGMVRRSEKQAPCRGGITLWTLRSRGAAHMQRAAVGERGFLQDIHRALLLVVNEAVTESSLG